ncbi:MAG: hypothetical protein VX447_00240 [Pseudomonadota bacterium]|uniref:hypothetical protein n=1 Tax=Gallaecimonas pentaromativorans TaxID=584787 RepID=UPI0009FAB404|nr:hypothetical protein [Gallaecimonas pentaromativorans]MED5523170.1 hypothetical protein [Pseudomonadota bacterium]
MNETEVKIFKLVKAELTDELIPKRYRGLVNNRFCGHCHHASLAMYNLLGGNEAGYKLKKAIDEKEIPHYWLVNSSNEIIDPTAEQYSELGRPFPYVQEKGERPSYRKSNATKKIISNVQGKL